MIHSPPGKFLGLSEGGRQLFRKPILRAGQFEKESEDALIEITQEHIDFLAGAFSHRIPVPLEHTEDPEKNRGWVNRVEQEGEALYGVFEFSALIVDPNDFDTSVYIPIKDGKMQPIRHVALTSYPVVDGLGKFEAIACSLVSPKELITVEWEKVKAAAGLSSDLTDENAVEVLSAHYADLRAKLAALECSNAKLKEELPPKEKQVVLSQKILKLAKDGREIKIKALKLSKAVQDKLVATYCSDEGVALALSETAVDNFDEVISALEQNEPLDFTEKSGVQLSDKSKEKESGLIINARNRAAAVKSKE